MRILLVEDSPRVSETVRDALRARGCSVVVAPTLAAATDAHASQPFTAAVVDVGMPDGSGLDWCRALRAAGSDLPILVLTARSGVPDRVEGLDAGADDYLGKPFAVDELLARLRALARRGPRWSGSVRRFGPVVVDADRRRVTVGGATLALTAREFEIVALLAGRQGRIVAREDILEAVWGDSHEGAGASLDVLVARIRRKLAEHGVRDALRTVRHVGHTWDLERSKPG
jgi:two-component system, OmpR family, response regulator